MEILQEIGAYAGLAAVVGLAVLSALYFSQARDVRRLREWAGRAPERVDEPASQQASRVTAQPQGAVHHQLLPPGLQGLQHLPDHHRQVPRPRIRALRPGRR